MFRKLLIIACLSCIVFIGYAQKNRKSKDLVTTGGQDYKRPGSPLPAVKFFSRDGKYITNKELDNNASLIVMLFNPTCEHCEEQTDLFRKNIFLFKKTNLVLVAGPMMTEHLDYFINNVKIREYPSIQVTVDSSNYIEKIYSYTNLPQINIYDKDRKLVRIFNGSTPLDSLKQYIE